jgi:hypothetical protein
MLDAGVSVTVSAQDRLIVVVDPSANAPDSSRFVLLMEVGMRRLPWAWMGLSVALLAFLVVAVAGPPVLLRWDLGHRAEQLSAAELASATSQIRAAIVQGLGAMAVLAGAYLAWRQLQHTMKATQAQIELQRAGTVTDRYTRAVEQLANTDQTIRVGAIHALDRIADEAPTERAGVVALLATYVRVRASHGWTDLDDRDPPLRSRASDIQAALTTLTRWIVADEVPPQWLTADIAHTDLPNANFYRSRLWHVRLRDVNLTGSNLAEADLCGADLRGAVLDDVDFTGAYANRRTWWPTGFDPQAHGITINYAETAYDRWPPKAPRT